MPETRTFDQEPGNDIQRQVREALGETIRPTQPGVVPTEFKDEEPDVNGRMMASVLRWGTFN